MHGPTPLGSRSAKAVPGKVPPFFVSVDASNSIFQIDSVNFEEKTIAARVPTASALHLLDLGREDKGVKV